MTTYINQIVQITRQLATTDSDLTAARSARNACQLARLNSQHNDLTAARSRLVMQALSDPETGLSRAEMTKTIQFATGMNDTIAKIQAQKGLVHLVAAAALELAAA